MGYTKCAFLSSVHIERLAGTSRRSTSSFVTLPSPLTSAYQSQSAIRTKDTKSSFPSYATSYLHTSRILGDVFVCSARVYRSKLVFCFDCSCVYLYSNLSFPSLFQCSHPSTLGSIKHVFLSSVHVERLAGAPVGHNLVSPLFHPHRQVRTSRSRPPGQRTQH